MKRSPSRNIFLVALSFTLTGAVFVAFRLGILQRLSSKAGLTTFLGLALVAVGALLAIWWRTHQRNRLTLLGIAFGNGVLGVIVVVVGLSAGRRSSAQDALIVLSPIFGQLAFIALPILAARAGKKAFPQ